MQRINYPKEQMHRVPYTMLTESQISNKLKPASAGPACVSDLSGVLAGKSLKIVTDEGPSLEYSFRRNNRLALSENGGRSVSCGYGALTLRQLVLFSHLVPGTLKGYTVVMDNDTNLVTVFEVWFSGYEPRKREVMREIYYGHVEQRGKPAPEKRHHLTNRIEGKGYYWKQDNGIETLEFYPSVIYSNFVELTRFGGELGFCGPSDYIKINDEQYIYARIECEFSGIMTMYALDQHRDEQVGMRLGLNEKDELEYYLFKGTGEDIGNIAKFEPFGDYGEKLPLGERVVEGKGGRPVYRPLLTNPAMTKEEVEKACAGNTRAFEPPPGSAGGGMAGNRLPASEYLAGREFTLRYDGGLVLEYKIDDKENLSWRPEGEQKWRGERYQSWEPDENVIMFGHLLSGTPRHEGVAIVIDFDNRLTSCVNGMLGTPYMANEAARKLWFGVIEADGITPPKYNRHQRTDELVGRALTWSYSPGLTSMHLYTTPHSMSWIIFLGNGAGGMEWSGPADYIKIRDDLYLFNWLEEACNGTLGVVTINMKTMHDCGVGYHCGTNGLSMSSVGAYARNAGLYDIKRFYDGSRES